MVVDHAMVHPRVDVIQFATQNRVAGMHVQVDPRRRLERRLVDAEAAEIADDEPE